MDDDLLARVCPVCGAVYAEHSLVDLAGCMESVDFVDDRPRLELVPSRTVELVAGPTLGRLL